MAAAGQPAQGAPDVQRHEGSSKVVLPDSIGQMLEEDLNGARGPGPGRAVAPCGHACTLPVRGASMHLCAPVAVTFGSCADGKQAKACRRVVRFRHMHIEPGRDKFAIAMAFDSCRRAKT